MLKRLALTAIASLAMVAPIGAAQTPAGSGAPPVASRDACPVEQHPSAINPDTIACHAAFAPLPVLPPEFDRAEAAHVARMNEYGDWLLGQLHRPEACGRQARTKTGEACAIIIYELDPAHRQAGLPWTYIVKIYRITHPKSIGDTIVYAMHSDSSERRLGGGTEEVWRLLADAKISRQCKEAADNFVGTGISGTGMRPDQCKSAAQDIRYRPKLLLGRGEAERVLNKTAIRNHFYVPPEVQRNVR